MSVLRYIATRSVAKQLQLLAVVVVGAVAGVLPIHLFRVVVDRAIPNEDKGLLAAVTAMLAVVLAIAAASAYLRAVLAEKVRHAFMASFRNGLFAHALRVSPDFYAKTSIGQLMSRVHLDVGRLGLAIPHVFVEPLVSGVTALVFVAYLLTMSVPLTLLALAALPIVAFAIPWLNDKLSANSKAFTTEVGKYASMMQESFSAHFEIQAHATYAHEEARLAKQQEKVFTTQLREVRLNARLGLFSDAARSIGPLLVYAYGGLLAISGELTVGQIVAFSGSLGGLYLALDKLIKYPPLLRNIQDRFDELSELFAVEAPFADGPGRKPLVADATPATAALDTVTFAYDAKQPIVKGIALELGPGEHVAFVGRSGSGKSTALGLLGGRLRAHAGTARIDGEPVGELTVESIASSVGYVGQHPLLFAGTVRDNLVYALLGRRAPADEELIDACAGVGLDDDLLDLGLKAHVSSARGAELLGVRAALSGLAGIERFDPSRYLQRGTIGENLLFSPTHVDPARLVEVAGLRELLIDLGRDAVNDDLPFLLRTREKNAALLVELGVTERELEERARLAHGADTAQSRAELARRALAICTDDEAIRTKIIAARREVARALTEVSQYDPNEWHEDLTVLDNLLFGRADEARVADARRIAAAVREALGEHRRAVVRWGLDFDVGEKGSRLSGGQKQKVSIARVMLKSPRLLLLDEATASLDERSAQQVQDLVRSKKATVVAVTHRLNALDYFTRVVVFERGRVVEDGAPAELLAKGGLLKQLHDASVAEGK